MPRLARLLSLSALLLAAGVRAEPPSQHKVQLQYTLLKGAQVCPDEEALRHAILAHMHEDPFLPGATARLSVVIRRVGQDFQASYELRDEAPPRVRTMPPLGDCGLAVEAAG